MATLWSWEYNRNQEVGAVSFDAASTKKDEFWQRLLKAVPVQAVGVVTAASAVANTATGDGLKLALGAVFLIGLGIAWAEMTRQRKVNGIELWVALAAYVVWSYAQGGIFVALDVWYPVAAGLIAIAFAAALPFVPKSAS